MNFDQSEETVLPQDLSAKLKNTRILICNREKMLLAIVGYVRPTEEGAGARYEEAAAFLEAVRRNIPDERNCPTVSVPVNSYNVSVKQSLCDRPKSARSHKMANDDKRNEGASDETNDGNSEKYNDGSDGERANREDKPASAKEPTDKKNIHGEAIHFEPNDEYGKHFLKKRVGTQRKAGPARISKRQKMFAVQTTLFPSPLTNNGFGAIPEILHPALEKVRAENKESPSVTENQLKHSENLFLSIFGYEGLKNLYCVYSKPHEHSSSMESMVQSKLSAEELNSKQEHILAKISTCLDSIGSRERTNPWSRLTEMLQFEKFLELFNMQVEISTRLIEESEKPHEEASSKMNNKARAMRHIIYKLIPVSTGSDNAYRRHKRQMDCLIKVAKCLLSLREGFTPGIFVLLPKSWRSSLSNIGFHALARVTMKLNEVAPELCIITKLINDLLVNPWMVQGPKFELPTDLLINKVTAKELPQYSYLELLSSQQHDAEELVQGAQRELEEISKHSIIVDVEAYYNTKKNELHKLPPRT